MLDVFTFTTMINVFCKGGRVGDAVDLFCKMEGIGVSPNVVAYNNVIDGLCKGGRLEEALKFKDRMIRSKMEKFKEANKVLVEMYSMGQTPNEVDFNVLIDGYCRKRDMDRALRVRDEMAMKGRKPNVVTFNTLLQGFCRSNQMELAEQVLGYILSSRLSMNMDVCSYVIHRLLESSGFDLALKIVTKLVLRNIKVSDSLLTQLVGGLCKCERHSEAIELWFKLAAGKGLATNTVTLNALLHGLCE
ncbi:hypothetical protein JHK82_053039 [Glycine max]|nr:hypothetical protein JHK86_052884 [Glycine max]KAG4927256.1 hypothetical protein JHK85_053742 [Glycine max]KAG5082876.1 hypothetical protein JHK84_052914 [Glycine max]KAG5085642.1 hypothetical protein JHK82_053039 [Glycine max]